MYCTKCGIELPKDANFCYKCGSSTGTIQIEGIEWEYGEVEFHRGDSLASSILGWGDKFWYTLEAVSPRKGKYQALKSREVKEGFSKWETTHEQLLDEFITQLTTKERWEPLPESKRRFRRKIH